MTRPALTLLAALAIAAEMREGRLSDEADACLRGLSVYIRKAAES